MEPPKVMRFFVCCWWILVLSLLNALVVVNASRDRLSGLLQDFVSQDFEDVSIGEKCKKDLITVRNGLEGREIWALKLLDSSGHIGSDFVWGNNIFIGSPRSCEIINDFGGIKLLAGHKFVGHPDLSVIRAPMHVGYRVMHARHKSIMQIDAGTSEKNVIDFGFCLPTSCDNEDSGSIFRALLENSTFVNGNLIGTNTEFIKTKTLTIRSDFMDEKFVRILMCACLTVVTLMALDLVNKFYKSMKNTDNLNDDVDKLKKHLKRNFWEKFLSCFSIVENVKIIASKQTGDDSIEAIHGIRVLGMVVFIVGHIALFAISSITNIDHILYFASKTWAQPLLTIHLTLDTFFVLSGLTLAYVFFQHAKKKTIKNRPKFFCKMIFNRLFRLTPPYMASLLLTVVVTKLVKDLSPYYLMDDNEIKCEKLWWQNLLYINNFYDLNNVCMIWSWFLPADFQCFVITAALMLIMNKNEKLGMLIFGVVFVGCTLLNGYFGYVFGYRFSLDSLYQTAQYLYTPFWSRIGPYFVGVFLGRYLSTNDRQLNLNKKLIIFGWTTAPIVNLSLIFGSVSHDVADTTAMLYTALARTLWGIGIAWIILTCATGHGGFVNKILSAKFFLPFSRMCFCVYLINPIWILFITMFNNSPYFLDFPMLLITSMGFTVTAFAIAFVFMLMFENPFVRLIKFIS